MTYREEQGDLFDLYPEYWLCQCISADFGMGAGIAVEFNKRFNQRNRMISKFASLVDEWDKKVIECGVGGMRACDEENKVINIITKRNVWHKPTYADFTSGLTQAMLFCSKNEIKKLAMPKIGCGLDRLEWGIVREIIKNVFKDIDIEIVVRYL